MADTFALAHCKYLLGHVGLGFATTGSFEEITGQSVKHFWQNTLAQLMEACTSTIIIERTITAIMVTLSPAVVHSSFGLHYLYASSFDLKVVMNQT